MNSLVTRIRSVYLHGQMVVLGVEASRYLSRHPVVHQQQIVSDYQEWVARGIGGGTDAGDVAELVALHRRSDWMDFAVGLEVEVLEQKVHYLVEIVGLVERLVCL